MSEYHGMRWFKMDFQVQTPEDNRHWADDDLRLLSPRRPLRDGVPNEEDIQSKAKRFLRRCHELELEVIGITDHNFSEKTEPRDWFLTHLVEQNKTVARELGRPPLFILPGFEVDIGYHALCLFKPATKVSHLRRVNMILIKLGLAENQRFRGGMPTALRRGNESISLNTLLDTVQNEHEGIVIAAHADQQDGLLSAPRNIDDYKLPGLLALELTGFPMSEKYRAILEGRNNEWSRVGRQPAYVQSSDAKSLQTDTEGRPLPNALGYRHTWVKSSKPSIISLRQAFLDGQSRLRLQVARPSDEQTHPRIVFLKCRGLKFLADQEVHFSPNLNTLIGGRGTGKSTALELLRFAFGRDQGDAFSASTRAKFERVKATYTDDAEIQVGWESLPGQVDVISLKPQEGHALLQGEAHDLEVYLRQLADAAGFLQAWDQMAPDGRSRLGRAWEHIGKELFESFLQYQLLVQPEADSPWLHIREVVAERRELPRTLLEYKDELKGYFKDQQDAWRVARLTRVEERVDIELYRADGTLVGGVQSQALSEGQRNTAVLNLLLAKGEGPIVIDQPEDELDSNFIYRELVPLLRKVKNQRQLILATHNANLPVNADTDLVYALEVAQGRGTKLAAGGLDRTDTATAVLDIMEGSAEAFKRRLDKYHF
ncbi:AAA family ATPase [Metapseudomonas resinovorans]|nr:AAA family ATPase [Pseudomonas resinovorans]